MYYYMSLWNISFLTLKPKHRFASNFLLNLLSSLFHELYLLFNKLSLSLKPMHGFVANLVWMFLWWTPTRFV